MEGNQISKQNRYQWRLPLFRMKNICVCYLLQRNWLNWSNTIFYSPYEVEKMWISASSVFLSPCTISCCSWIYIFCWGILRSFGRSFFLNHLLLCYWLEHGPGSFVITSWEIVGFHIIWLHDSSTAIWSTLESWIGLQNQKINNQWEQHPSSIVWISLTTDYY